MLAGYPMIAPSSIYQTWTASNAPSDFTIGSICQDVDGSLYRFVQAGAVALVPGTLVQSPAVVANHQNIAVAAAAAVGSKTVTVTLGATAATANQYAGGYLVINDVDGEGNTYKILSHPAAALSTSLVLTLEETVRVALTTSSEVCLQANNCMGVIINPTTPTGTPVGVAVSAVPINGYGFVKSRGPVGCLSDASAPAVGAAVSPSNATAGAVESGVLAQGIIGRAQQAGVSTEYRTIFIQID